MARNLDANLAAHLSDGLIQPAFLASFQFRSGVTNAWTGVGPFTWNGLTFQGVGNLGKISPVVEGTSVQADGITVQLANQTFIDAGGSNYPNGPLNSPASVPAGQYVAWTTPTAVTAFGNPAADYSSPQGWAQAAYGTLSGGSMSKSGNDFAETQWTGIQWSGFTMPVLPADAVIQAIYPVVLASGNADDDPLTFDTYGGGVSPGTGYYSGEYHGRSIGTTASSVTTLNLAMRYQNSGASVGLGNYSNITFVGLAIYYTSSVGGSTAQSIQTDIQQGAPAYIWYAQLQNGQLLGTPYLVFAGMVDQPTIEIDTNTIVTTLSLENRLTQLQRPNARRYTAADQRLYYPDDTGFNWVEMLNDASFRWGS